MKNAIVSSSFFMVPSAEKKAKKVVKRFLVDMG